MIYSFDYFLKFKINETSFYDFIDGSFITDEYVKKFIREQDETKYRLEEYCIIHDIDETNKSNIIKTIESDGFLQYMKKILLKFNEMFDDNIYPLINNNILTIYRKIEVDDDWLPSLDKTDRNLGVYWSYEEEAAEAHWGNDLKNTVLMVADIDQSKYVNWEKTIEQNTHPLYFEEKEINIYENSPIILKRLYINNERVNISFLKNKIFKA